MHLFLTKNLAITMKQDQISKKMIVELYCKQFLPNSILRKSNIMKFAESTDIFHGYWVICVSKFMTNIYCKRITDYILKYVNFKRIYKNSQYKMRIEYYHVITGILRRYENMI